MKAGIIGGAGYTGRELIKILLKHQEIEKIYVYGRRDGAPLSDEISEIKGLFDDVVLPIEPDKIIEQVDVLFMALPHKISMEYAPLFQDKVLLIDLSADYRLDNADIYQKYYEVEHKDISMLGKYTYGLPELNREDIKQAKNIANPGCYPTSVILGALPLIEKSLVEGDIIADSKSGHSGGGKKLSDVLHASNVSDNIQPYKILKHQHIGEMEQLFAKINHGKTIKLTFTPYVMPFDRGILSTIYINLNKSITQAEVDNIYKERYKNEPFIRLFNDALPNVKNVSYSNFCDISCSVNSELNRVTIISCIDNLIKGASGQAVQNMNIAMGFDEKEGLYA